MHFVSVLVDLLSCIGIVSLLILNELLTFLICTVYRALTKYSFTMSAENHSIICTEENTLVFPSYEIASKWIFTNIETTIYLTIFIVIIAVGFVGNFSFIYAVAKVSKLRTAVNFYLLNLAVADLMFLFITAVYYIATFLYSPVKENIPYDGTASCLLMFSPAMLCYYASLGIIILMSVDRFFAICHPLRYHFLRSKKRTARLLLAVWIISIGPAAFTTLRYSNHTTLCVKWPNGEKYKTMPETINLCTAYIEGPTFNTVAASVFLTAFFVPMIVIGIMNGKIAATLKRKNRPPSSRFSHFNSIRNQVTRTLLILVTLFFVFQLPLRSLSALYIIRHVIGHDFFNHSVEQMCLIIGRILVLMNSATNSFVYLAFSPHYRDSFMEAFGLKKI